jgi:chorismate mutase
MIESHIDPDHAWSDASQQITPEQLNTMLQNLVWRSVKNEDAAFITALQKLREQVDQLDDELLSLMAQRMKMADKIGIYKKENQMTILQTERFNAILRRAFAKADQLGLSREFIQRYFDAVHMESINHQNNVMNG